MKLRYIESPARAGLTTGNVYDGESISGSGYAEYRLADDDGAARWIRARHFAVVPEQGGIPAAEPSQHDAVILPPHYGRFKIEPIYFILENGLSFDQGNIIKYVCRYDAKNGVEDLKKARRYLDILIKRTEGDPNYAG